MKETEYFRIIPQCLIWALRLGIQKKRKGLVGLEEKLSLKVFTELKALPHIGESKMLRVSQMKRSDFNWIRVCREIGVKVIKMKIAAEALIVDEIAQK